MSFIRFQTKKFMQLFLLVNEKGIVSLDCILLISSSFIAEKKMFMHVLFSFSHFVRERNAFNILFIYFD